MSRRAPKPNRYAYHPTAAAPALVPQPQPARRNHPGGIEAIIISLQRTPERTARAIGQIAPLALPTTILWATDCQCAASMAALPVVAPMQPGEIALLESMRRAMALIVRRGLDWCLVFEDDAEEVRPGILSALRALPADTHFAVLHDQRNPEPQWLPECTGPFQRVARPAWQSHATAVSQAGARAILSALATFSHPYDEALRQISPHLSVWQCRPREGFYRQPFDLPSTVRDSAGGSIPRAIHQIWVGPNPLPEEFAQYARQWEALHPGWSYCLWTNDKLAAEYPEHDPAAWGSTWAAQSDVWRLLILERFGGLYVDTDFEPFRSFEPLVAGAAFLATRIGVQGGQDDNIANGLLACEPGHPLIRAAVAAAMTGTAQELPILEAAGPAMMTRVLGDVQKAFRKPVHSGGQEVGSLYGDTGVVVLHEPVCYPYLWHHARPSSYPATAWAAHHWARSWWTPQDWGASGEP